MKWMLWYYPHMTSVVQLFDLEELTRLFDFFPLLEKLKWVHNVHDCSVQWHSGYFK